jgi:HTH-type transcriptional regulator/antitoxin HipB
MGQISVVLLRGATIGAENMLLGSSLSMRDRLRFLFPMGNEKLEIRESSAALFPLGNRNIGVNMAKVKLQTVAEIGALIRTTRKKQRVSQAVLAGLASVGTRFISDLENGKGTIQVQKLLDVLNALGLGLYIFNRWEDD